MKNKTLYLLLSLIFLVLSLSSQAQGSNLWKRYRHDFGVGYGFNNLLTTLGEKDNVTPLFLLQRSSLNLSYRYFVFNHFAVRGQFTQLSCRKNDKDLNVETRENLRLDYMTSMSEFAVTAEYHLFDESGKVRSGKTARARGGLGSFNKFGVSFYGGIAASYFRPYAEYFGNKVYLRPLNDNPGVDPNVDAYNKWNLVFPVGATVRYVISESWRVGLEGSYRFGIRNYIDDVSGVYYGDEAYPATKEWTPAPDKNYVGQVYFGKENQDASQLSLQGGRKGYFVGMITLSYRLKTR